MAGDENTIHRAYRFSERQPGAIHTTILLIGKHEKIAWLVRAFLKTENL